MFIKKNLHLLSYLGIRIACFPLAYLPLPIIHFLGKILGRITYYLHGNFRKKTLTNLSIAKSLNLSDKEKRKIAKESFETLAITCLEFFRLHRENIDNLIELSGSLEEIQNLLKEKKGIVFLSAHQANWEIPFLYMSQHYTGIAIGRPIKNQRLYRWILSLRQRYQGKIIMPKHAIKEGLNALKKGEFLGIVGDQAFPGSSYSYPLFGIRAWTASTPALLSYRTGAPLVVGTTRRTSKGKYEITGHPPLWPDLTKPMKEEVTRLMDGAMQIIENSIQKTPGQWLWQHDRWKQQGIDHVKREYRFGFVLVIIPKNTLDIQLLMTTFREIYPRAFISYFIPEELKIEIKDENTEIYPYTFEKDLFVKDYRHQIVYDLTDNWKLRFHFRKLGAFKTLNIKTLEKLAMQKGYLPSQLERSKLLKLAICK